MEPGQRILRQGDRSFYERDILFADPAFLSIFSFPLVAGNPASFAADPRSAILSKSAARQYFRDEDPIGQTLTLDNTVVLWAWLWTNDCNAQTALTNFTALTPSYTQLGNDGTIGVQYWIQTTAANVANQQSTVTPVTDGDVGQNVSVMVSLKETLVRYVKLLAPAAAASAASIEGVVLNAARDTVIGEFTGQTFEATLESGSAVLLIPCADITPDGGDLTTSETPLVVAYNSTHSTDLASATVVEV